MKRPFPSDQLADVISSYESSSSDPDIEVDNGSVDKKPMDITIEQPARQEALKGIRRAEIYSLKVCLDADAMIRSAEMYQEDMKQIPIPALPRSLIPFDSWMGLAKSIKQLYGQPLHYLTNILVKQWDGQRIGAKDENWPMYSIIHPIKAEAIVWLIEEIHQLMVCPDYMVKLWLSDPMHHAFIDALFPILEACYSERPVSFWYSVSCFLNSK